MSLFLLILRRPPISTLTATLFPYTTLFQSVLIDDPTEAQRLLQPGLMEPLLALAEELGEDGLNGAFLDGRFLLAIPQRRNLFEIGRLNRSLEHAEDDPRRLAAEFTIPHRLIDNLHGARKPLLPET